MKIKTRKMDKQLKKAMLEFVHYVVVFVALLLAWVPVMEFFKDDVTQTAIATFVIFIVTDKLAHKYILKEK
jgi:predicted permease